MTAPGLVQPAVTTRTPPAAAATEARWRRTLAEHQAVDGRCPRCNKQGRCWEWAEAFGQLVAHDLLLPK
ncbi:hypothetical protein OOJ91_13575 [Micromonospora lupini]|uniref:hypothetical protein n=1 Tax=Micromonospora lupini TaxID=285679 RepID=UPI002253DD6D|nr:hypothetical protein [Micromonospora lupini]MCX5066876.1 hypothetical protein [Micromonospora lupini]